MDLVKLAKKAVEKYIREGKIISPPKNLKKEFLEKRSGVFVTIEKCSQKTNSLEKEKCELRGCIGTYLPTKENIANEVIHSAISAATLDFRFGAISKEELPYLKYTVYILSNPQLVKDIKELNPKKFGIIVVSKNNPSKIGLLLPDLEGIETVEKQIFIASQKADIDINKEKILIYKFKAKKFQ